MYVCGIRFRDNTVIESYSENIGCQLHRVTAMALSKWSESNESFNEIATFDTCLPLTAAISSRGVEELFC